MRDQYKHLPDDIASENRTAFEIRKSHRQPMFFANLRAFSALRRQAPGIIAQYAIGGMISLMSLAAFFRNYSERHPDGSGWYALVQLLIIFFASLLAGHLIWRAIGVSLRDRFRYLVRNMWIIVGIVFLVLVLLASLATLVAP